jgi:glucose-6-phosphate 1-dehydrogenase
MTFRYQETEGSKMLPDPYEKLLFDVISGDQTFFNSPEEAEAQWNFIDKLTSHNKAPIPYEPGSWGPDAAQEMIKNDDREWILD